MLAFNLDAVAFQYAHNALWCRAAIGILAHGHAAEAQAGHAVDILFQRYGIEAGALINLFGHRVLQQNAVDIGVGIQGGNFLQQLLSAGGGGKFNCE